MFVTGKKKVCSYLRSQIFDAIFSLPALRAASSSISQSNELRLKDCHQSQSLFLSRAFVNIFPLILLELKHAVINVVPTLEEHAIRDKLNLNFGNV